LRRAFRVPSAAERRAPVGIDENDLLVGDLNGIPEARTMSDLQNPYAPPKSQLGAASRVDDLEDAAISKRLLNLVIDEIGMVLVLVVLAAVTGRTAHGLFKHLVGIEAMFLYYLFFEGVFARTPGKLVTGTRVVARDGAKPRFRQIVGRTFARLVPFEPFSFLTSARTGWHDDWSGTRVVVVR
jgi:uncharacterized RDD family membrane protein YckC